MMKMMGSDGIERDIDEHYDCVSGVKEDPFGAHQAIQDLWADTERLRWQLRSYTQLGGDADRYSAIWREENPFNDKEPSK